MVNDQSTFSGPTVGTISVGPLKPATLHGKKSAMLRIPPEGVPGRLIDSWARNERSREYLNDEIDKFDLDRFYYSTAYKNM